MPKVLQYRWSDDHEIGQTWRGGAIYRAADADAEVVRRNQSEERWHPNKPDVYLEWRAVDYHELHYAGDPATPGRQSSRLATLRRDHGQTD